MRDTWNATASELYGQVLECQCIVRGAWITEASVLYAKTERLEALDSTTPAADRYITLQPSSNLREREPGLRKKSVRKAGQQISQRSRDWSTVKHRCERTQRSK